MDTTTILVLVPHYLPSYKAGGPVRSIAGLVNALGQDFLFKVVCSDRDLGDSVPDSSEPVGRWYDQGPCKVFRVPPRMSGYLAILQILRHEPYDVLYLNSVMARMFSLFPLSCRMAGITPRRPTIVAPRGEFASAALSIKASRKRMWLALASMLGLYKPVTWQASCDHERADIKRAVGNAQIKTARAITASDVVTRPQCSQTPVEVASIGRTPLAVPVTARRKTKGNLRVVTIGRISEMKNIAYAIRLVKGLTESVVYDIYGPLEDKQYGNVCKRECNEVPPNVRIQLCGPLPHDLVHTTLEHYDLFLLPTRGENFGHVVVEAMQAGLPVLISDRTPWKNLAAAGAGWDLSLDHPELFRAALREGALWTGEQWASISQAARSYAAAHQTCTASVRENRHMFESVVDNAGVCSS